ncbi:MAG: hypothetical protein ACFFB0_21345 [Promethearchaeota archaeon]
MGRRLKYGEKTKWVSVRVPESKVQLLRGLVREFIEILFLHSIIPKKKLLERFVVKILVELGKSKESTTKNVEISEFSN